MIVTTDIANILYRDCKSFGIDIVPHGKKLTGAIKSERIVIHAKKQQPGTYWKKSFVEVNICVPDLKEGEANTIRLNEREKLRGVFQMLDGNVLMLAHPSSGDNIFYKVRDGNCIILIDSFGNEPQKEVRKNYILKKKG
jgi:hypothetical protein